MGDVAPRLPRGAAENLPRKAWLFGSCRLLQPQQSRIQVEGQGQLPFTKLVVRSLNVPNAQQLGF